MTPPSSSPPQTQPPRPRASRVYDDLGYILPMAAFLVFVQVGNSWPSLFVASYVARTIAAAALLVAFRRHFTPIRWNHWWLGIVVGVIGVFQWVLMQQWLERHCGFFAPAKPDDVFDPTKSFASPVTLWAFIAVRTIGASLVVPFMEELFWRDFLWRQVLAPNDFKLAAVGEWAWTPFIFVTGAFCTVHGNFWLTAVGWGAMVAGLLVWTRSLGACIVAHAVTNFLLACYVLRWHAWAFW